MSINIPQVGNPRNIILDLTNTSVTNIYTGSSKLRGVANSVSICNDSGGAATFTLTITDNNGVTVKIYNQKSVASNDTLILTQHEIPIPQGWSLDIQAGTANTLHIVAVIVELVSTQG